MKKHKLLDFKGKFFKIIQTTGKSQVGTMTIEPGGDSGPEAVHDADQIIYIIEGEARVEINRKKERLEAGELVMIEAGSQHHIYNKSNSTLFFLTIYAPPEY